MFKVTVAFLLFLFVASKAQQPQFNGDLTTFFKENTVYPTYSLNNCIEGVVNIGFKLNKKGQVYDAMIEKGIGTDLDQEALRLIKMSSEKWMVPLTHDTLALLVVPINFTLKGYGCEMKDKATIALAIKAYKVDEELTKVVLNFYRNKEKGTHNEADESKILSIKNELNVDEEYLDDKIAAGLRKYKQGDKKGACEDFNFVKYMGSDKANNWLSKYCK